MMLKFLAGCLVRYL